MPAPADVQTANGGTTAGRAQAGDSVNFTFASTVDPGLVLTGWDGSPTTVTARIVKFGGSDSLIVQDPGNGMIWPLGGVELGAYYANDVDFAGSTMTASGNTVTVVLGPAGPGAVHTVSVPATMTWWCPTGTGWVSVTESGLADVEF
jgi:hypothetical protein